MNIPEKPSPIVNDWARPFWEAAKEHRLIIQRCSECGKYVFYPRLACPHCFSDHVEWVDASGKGTVYSCTVVETNAPSAFMNDIPYVVAVVKLDEGVRMLSNIVGCNPHDVQCDMRVEVTFEKLNDEFTLPKFKPTNG
jgi:uncharacterized OB-fold protein